MKKRRLLLSLLTVGLFLGVSAQVANADANKYVHSFPKATQSTWYSYNKKQGYTKLKITAKQLTVTKQGKTQANFSLHKYQKHDPKQVTKAQQNWIYAWPVQDATELYGWGQQFGAGSFLTVKKAHKVQQLTVNSMQEKLDSGQYYQTKKLAKQLVKYNSKANLLM